MSDYVTWLRGKIGTRRVFLAYAAAIVGDERGRILCHRRADFERWGLPGGVLEVGETLEACAEREVEEETGVRVAAGDVVGVYSSPDYAFAYPNGDEVQQFTVCFACSPRGGALGATSADSVEAAFFPADALPPLFPVVWCHGGGLPERGAPHLRAGGAGRASRPRAGIPAAAPARRLGDLDHAGRRRVDPRRGGPYPSDAASRRRPVDRARRRHGAGRTGRYGARSRGGRGGRTRGRPAGTRRRPLGPALEVTFPNGDRIQAVTAFFTCDVVAGTPRADGVEGSEVRFFGVKELPAEPAWMGLLKEFLEMA